MADETELPTKIGYKSPPIEHRFKKGQSGNPKGRPRKSPARQAHREVWVTGLSADEALLDEAYRLVQVREADEVKSMSALTAVYRSLATAAVKGDRFARKLFTESVRNAEARKQAELREMIDIVSSYKERCYEAFRIADARGVPRPEFVPHPDDCVMGANGMPDIVGPFDEARKAAWDEARRRIADADGDIAEFRRMAARNPDLAVLFHDAIMREERLKRTLDFMMPDEATRRRHGYEKPTVGLLEHSRRRWPGATGSSTSCHRTSRKGHCGNLCLSCATSKRCCRAGSKLSARLRRGFSGLACEMPVRAVAGTVWRRSRTARSPPAVT